MVDYPDYWVFTIQISRWRYARDLNIPMIDITAKSGIQTFAPNWEDLMAYKRGEVDNHEYSIRYLKKVLPTVQTHPDDWEILRRHKTFALACYCKSGEFCHRHIFSALVVTYLQSLGEQVQFKGEMIPHPDNLQYYYRQAQELDRMRREHEHD
jgi:hypothetical protein